MTATWHRTQRSALRRASGCRRSRAGFWAKQFSVHSIHVLSCESPSLLAESTTAHERHQGDGCALALAEQAAWKYKYMHSAKTKGPRRSISIDIIMGENATADPAIAVSAASFMCIGILPPDVPAAWPPFRRNFLLNTGIGFAGRSDCHKKCHNFFFYCSDSFPAHTRHAPNFFVVPILLPDSQVPEGTSGAC